MESLDKLMQQQDLMDNSIEAARTKINDRINLIDEQKTSIEHELTHTLENKNFVVEKNETNSLKAIYKKLVIDISLINQLANYNKHEATHILKDLDTYNLKIDIKIERDRDDFGENFKITCIFNTLESNFTYYINKRNFLTFWEAFDYCLNETFSKEINRLY
ncbi:hypothetical protein J507_3165 [Acinetobacter sp. 1295259]|uniref:hypothetical protein n=1 Tax=Acinetobacter calcoaceticus/baumannii complex TaxID=909768 RepID=UPI0004503AA8|nr:MULTISPECIES: hypothetical protein [Acinetobacter calcoaceticus/baumannii complex]EXA96564.1 hypothetical protein J507_3165 [Acinetobacter sp. 1295259]MDC4449265.1 hypothetical protein [Acinetobacter baumannii]MDC5303118.1 hypothetical protein [Acinetobacter baumannii]RSO69549.1 hypothetical protein EA754_20020 [Acinetobacter pittii]